MKKTLGLALAVTAAIALSIWGVSAATGAPAPEPTQQVTVQQPVATVTSAPAQAPAVDTSTELPAPPTKCPEGSQANSADESGDTSCYWEICFHLTLPDSTHPECNSDFKP